MTAVAVALALVCGALPLFTGPAAVAQDAAAKPYLGLVAETNVQPPTVRYVHEDSPAEKMGLQKGDVILACNGSATPTLSQLASVVSAARVGDAIMLRIRRGTGELELTGELAAAQPIVGNPARELSCTRWGNLPEGVESPTIESLRGKVVLIHCFQHV